MHKDTRVIKKNFADFNVQQLSELTVRDRMRDYLTSRATPDMDYRGEHGVFLVLASEVAEDVHYRRIIGTFEGLFDDVLTLAVRIEEFWPFSMPNYSGYIEKLDVIQVKEGGVTQTPSI